MRIAFVLEVTERKKNVLVTSEYLMLLLLLMVRITKSHEENLFDFSRMYAKRLHVDTPSDSMRASGVM